MVARASRTAGSAALALALLASAAGAQPSPDREREARGRFERGIAMFERGDNAAALAEFLAAYELAPRPSVLFNLAATYEALRRYPEAVDAYDRFLATPGGDRHDRARAERSLARLRPLLATLQVRTNPPGAAVTVDEVAPRDPAAVSVSPGEHRVAARWPDGREVVARVVVASAQTREVLLDAPASVTSAAVAAPASAPTARLALRGVPAGASMRVDGALHPFGAYVELPHGPHVLRVEAQGRVPWEGAVSVTARPQVLALSLAAPARGPSPVAFWLTAGAAAAMLVGASITGAMALDTHADFSSRYREDPALESLSARGRSLSIAADVLGLGALLAGVGAVVLGTQTTFSPPRSTASLREE